jgi:hypothetical protein
VIGTPQKIEPNPEQQPPPKPGEVLEPPSHIFDEPPIDEAINKAKQTTPVPKDGTIISIRKKLIKFKYAWKEVSPDHYRAYCTVPDGPSVHGVNMVLYVHTTGCKNVVVYQYFTEMLTFYDKDGKVLTSGYINNEGASINSDKSPQVDIQQPYPFQTLGPDPIMEDSAGFGLIPSDPLNPAPYIKQAAEKFQKEGIPKATKMTSEKMFWSYYICIDPTPSKVLGHYEWGFTITFDVNKTPGIDPPFELEPEVKWIPDK